MKQIEIADQPRLGLVRTVRVTVDGIRYRLFRASVTVAVIAVAVAFLMNILSESLIKRTVARNTRERLARMRLVYDWAARLTKPGTPAVIIGELAGAGADDAVYRETAAIGKLTPDTMKELHESAQQAARYLAFFNSLDYARRRSLVHTAAGMAIFDRLATPVGWAEFTDSLKDMKSVRFVTSLEELTDFLSRWPVVRELIERVRQGRADAIRKVDEARQGRPILEALVDADGTFGEAVRKAGFHFDAEKTAPEVAVQARRILDTGILEKSIEHRWMRQAIAQMNNILPGDVTVVMLWNLLRDRKAAGRYLDKMKESGIHDAGLDPERLVSLAENRQEEAALVKAEWLTADVGAGWMGLGRRMSWLLFVSILVCAIGISNAMLMSVTERFREIATMKCLGALDGFIMVMFVLESCFLGVAGGVIGAVIGSLIGLGRMLVMFGRRFADSVAVIDLVHGIIVAVCLGVALAAVAAVYPALKAARLAPMEAMRIE